MKKIPAEDLAKRLPEILSRIEKGESFIITDHSRPAAQLGPVLLRDIVWHEDEPTLKSR